MADKKISQLTAASTPLTGTEELAIVQSGSTVKATAQDVADLAGAPYLVYTALLSQSGTSAPVATVLHNTLGFVPTWGYTSVGWYASVNSGFTANTVIFMGQFYADPDPSLTAVTFTTSRTPSSGGKVNVQSRGNGTLDNNLLYETAIEIRVYP